MKERQEDSVQQWNCPTQAKTGLEWATRRAGIIVGDKRQFDRGLLRRIIVQI